MSDDLDALDEQVKDEEAAIAEVPELAIEEPVANTEEGEVPEAVEAQGESVAATLPVEEEEGDESLKLTPEGAESDAMPPVADEDEETEE